MEVHESTRTIKILAKILAFWARRAAQQIAEDLADVDAEDGEADLVMPNCLPIEARLRVPASGRACPTAKGEEAVEQEQDKVEITRDAGRAQSQPKGGRWPRAVRAAVDLARAMGTAGDASEPQPPVRAMGELYRVKSARSTKSTDAAAPPAEAAAELLLQGPFLARP